MSHYLKTIWFWINQLNLGIVVYGTTVIFNFNQILNSISNNLDYIIFDILNQFNILCFWPISPKLGLAIINFKQKLTILSSFPLILNHCSISIGKNQLITHVIANNHKNVRKNWWPYWLESIYAKGPM